MYMVFPRGVRGSTFIATALSLCLALAGCATQGQGQPGVQSADPQIISDYNSTASDDYNFETASLTTSATFQGLTFSVDPNWTKSSAERGYLLYTVPTGNSSTTFELVVTSYLNGETKDLDTLRNYDVINDTTGDSEATESKEIDGITLYRVTWESKVGGSRSDYLVGYDDTTGHGFVMEFGYSMSGKAATAPRTRSNCEAMTKVFQSVKYDPSKTTYDYHDIRQEEMESWAERSTETQGDTSASNDSNGSADTTSNLNTNTSSRSTIDEDNAMTAFEREGKREYPYGFKCHWITNWITREQLSDGSWSYKVGVTVTNEYGASRDTTAEATIGGTNDNPVVGYFYVY